MANELEFRVLGTLKGFNKAEGHTYLTVDPSFGCPGLDNDDHQIPFSFTLDKKLKVSDIPIEQEALFIGNFARTNRPWTNPQNGNKKMIENHRFIVTKIEVPKRAASPV
jgi:hypothetical protein